MREFFDGIKNAGVHGCLFDFLEGGIKTAYFQVALNGVGVEEWFLQDNTNLRPDVFSIQRIEFMIIQANGPVVIVVKA